MVEIQCKKLKRVPLFFLFSIPPSIICVYIYIYVCRIALLTTRAAFRKTIEFLFAFESVVRLRWFVFWGDFPDL